MNNIEIPNSSNVSLYRMFRTQKEESFLFRSFEGIKQGMEEKIANYVLYKTKKQKASKILCHASQARVFLKTVLPKDW